MAVLHERHQLSYAVLVSVGVGHRLPEHVHQSSVVGLIERHAHREGRVQAEASSAERCTPRLRTLYYVTVRRGRLLDEYAT